MGRPGEINGQKSRREGGRKAKHYRVQPSKRQGRRMIRKPEGTGAEGERRKKDGESKL